MLLKTVDPIRFGKQQTQLEGDIALKTLPRLQEICDQENQKAQIILRFDIESRLYVIRGQIKAVVRLICQRCNAPMNYDMDIAFVLSPVNSEERAKNLPKAIEPVFMCDEIIAVHEMIEEEILLALPMISKHEY